jgi:hypothetical protein|eukprot:CAMPEP_0174301674 /NCGR_PEP_ID=MMETSP0809-20121228/59185_1 /TAXON_ID=73025 ORGANISM="Eutreptiella gymnastica-like, Strain CCMP1594" /NCGR_SAMPLE_ID=MMETSP0809 /ASSEMBLY_ACC=CAM_ASM_000658 /LENGTH=70 /DNA_ID=CAMNT_0015407459 /DNA_START=1980 /DNA_END=2192 /DNA_ORIENTATION=-
MWVTALSAAPASPTCKVVHPIFEGCCDMWGMIEGPQIGQRVIDVHADESIGGIDRVLRSWVKVVLSNSSD